jgi:hypothetical protein
MESSNNTLQQLMFSLIEVWKSSGKTQMEFCKEKDIAYHKFHYWFRKYNRQSSEPMQASFTRINVNALPVNSGFMELIYPDGRKLVFNQHVDAAFLRSLLG